MISVFKKTIINVHQTSGKTDLVRKLQFKIVNRKRETEAYSEP